MIESNLGRKGLIFQPTVSQYSPSCKEVGGWCTHALECRYPQSPEESPGSPGAGVTGEGERPDMGAGNCLLLWTSEPLLLPSGLALSQGTDAEHFIVTMGYAVKWSERCLFQCICINLPCQELQTPLGFPQPRYMNSNLHYSLNLTKSGSDNTWWEFIENRGHPSSFESVTSLLVRRILHCFTRLRNGQLLWADSLLHNVLWAKHKV